jgi:anti-anti-sigma factor
VPSGPVPGADCGHLKVRVKHGGGVCLLPVSGELDFASAEDFTEWARRLVDGRTERLVLDLSGLVFADCAGCGRWPG